MNAADFVIIAVIVILLLAALHATRETKEKNTCDSCRSDCRLCQTSSHLYEDYMKDQNEKE